jgi:hypothetical protein
VAKPCEGALLLGAFLKKHGLPDAAVTTAIGVSAPVVHEWLAGTYRPTLVHRLALAKWTHDYIPAEAWQTAAEQAAVGRLLDEVVPFGTKRNGTEDR